MTEPALAGVDPNLVAVALDALRECNARDDDPMQVAECVVRAVVVEQWRIHMREMLATVFALSDDTLTRILDSNPHLEQRMRDLMDRELSKLAHPSRPSTVLRPVD